jgi:hypothetical protein
MESPLRKVHVMLSPDQISYLKSRAARRHLSASALIREWIEQEQKREKLAARRLAARPQND